jgi:anti-sigma factor RsiW
MTCPVQAKENAEVLLAYCARTLEAEAAAAFERHLEHCEHCRSMAQAQQAVWAALDAWEAAEVPEDFDRRLYKRIEAEAANPWWKRMVPDRRMLAWKPAFGLAAAGMAVFAIALMRSPEVPPPSPSADSIDVEQVERTLEDLEMLRQFHFSPRPEGTRSL